MRVGDLVAYCDELLDAAKGEDYGPNGLQVEGRREIRRIVTGVSACVELFERAARVEADAVLVHHGILWNSTGARPIVGSHYSRLATLIESGLHLLAYHLPLDRHPELGNNVLAARQLGLFSLEPFALYRGLPIGFRGTYPEPITPAELLERCTSLFGQEPVAFLAGASSVSTVGVVSGGAQGELHQAIEAGLDAYVTGEASEWVMTLARESRIHFLACGHYATERSGIRALGEHLAGRFGVEHEFIDIPNPV
jgi:dinuclear metal center YbgI/SA1388 family protein